MPTAAARESACTDTMIDEEDEATLTITVHPSEGALRISVAGELDLYTAPEMQQALDKACDPVPKELIFDFRDLDFIDSAGLALLINVYRRLGENCAITLRVSPEGQVRQVMELSRFDRFFHVESVRPEV